MTSSLSNDDTFELETASSDALVQLQMLSASCSLIMALDDSQTTISHVAAIMQVCVCVCTRARARGARE